MAHRKRDNMKRQEASRWVITEEKEEKEEDKAPSSPGVAGSDLPPDKPRRSIQGRDGSFSPGRCRVNVQDMVSIFDGGGGGDRNDGHDSSGRVRRGRNSPSRGGTDGEGRSVDEEDRGSGDEGGRTGGWEPIKQLLFGNNATEQQFQDTGKWNELFQEALDLPEETVDQKYCKWQRLTAVNRDFVAAAVTYGKTIISEYFLDHADKSIKPDNRIGGVAGGEKFLWRGILFKLADGSKGPYHGNDEAAAKGAGHDLRGATHYLATRIRGLHYALQCLIDYKGFRMTAQAALPVSSKTLQYGTANAAKTIFNNDTDLAEKLKKTARMLNLRTHTVNGKEMYSACDVEGHKGEDGRHYLLDFARSFPPESPYLVDHLSDILSNGTRVGIKSTKERGVILSATVPKKLKLDRKIKGQITYAVLIDTKEVREVPGTDISDLHLSIFWRMLRPEFVKGDSEMTRGARAEAAVTPTEQASDPAPVNNPALGTMQIFSTISERPELENSISSATTTTTAGATFVPLGSGGPRQGSYDADFLDTSGREGDGSEHGDVNAFPANGVSASGAGAVASTGTAVPATVNGEEVRAKHNPVPASTPGHVRISSSGSGSGSGSSGGGDSSRSSSSGGGGGGGNEWAGPQPRVQDGRRPLPPQTPTSQNGATAGRVREQSPAFPGAAQDGQSYQFTPTRPRVGHDRGGPRASPGDHARYRESPTAARGTPSGRGGGERGGGDDPSDTFIPSRRGIPYVVQDPPDGIRAGSYEAYMDYDEGRETERGSSSSQRGSFRGGGSRSSRRIGNIANRSAGSYHFPTSWMVRAGSGSGSARSAPLARQTSYINNDQSGRYSFKSHDSFGFFRGGSEGHVAGAIGRAPPRVILLDATLDHSANKSYHFYHPDANKPYSGPALVTATTTTATIPNDSAEDEWKYPPLSPDALSVFTRTSEDRSDRNQEVHDATSVMVRSVIPVVAELLTKLSADLLETIDLAIELHRHGVNVRHLGKVRWHAENHHPKNQFLLDMLLTEMIARTLKNILRCFQRQWMKAERSTSEQGMMMLVVEFLNLVTGFHDNSATFWEGKVLTGVLQRFGLVSLTIEERKNFWRNCIKYKPRVLRDCVWKLTEMQGVVLTSVAVDQFASEDPVNFRFVVADIQEIKPIVRYMHILDYGGGVMLSMQADKLRERKTDKHTVARLEAMAKRYFIGAHQSLPGDWHTRSHVLSFFNPTGIEVPRSDPSNEDSPPRDIIRLPNGLVEDAGPTHQGCVARALRIVNRFMTRRDGTRELPDPQPRPWSSTVTTHQSTDQSEGSDDDGELDPAPDHAPGHIPALPSGRLRRASI